jgi:hypothetical protein
MSQILAKPMMVRRKDAGAFACPNLIHAFDKALWAAYRRADRLRVTQQLLRRYLNQRAHGAK